jgi:hypothetical protein
MFIKADTVEDKWKALKECLIQTAEQVCGLTTKHQWHKQTWWWNDAVNDAVKEKRRFYKAWKAGGSITDYKAAKRNARRAVYYAKNGAQKIVLEKIDLKSADIYKLAKQLKRDNQDVIGEKPVKNDAGELSLHEDNMKLAWQQHYEQLLNLEFPCNPCHLTHAPPVEGPSEEITTEMVSEAIKKMDMGKASGPSGIVAEMLKPTGTIGTALVKDLIDSIIHDGRIPEEWQELHSKPLQRKRRCT